MRPALALTVPAIGTLMVLVGLSMALARGSRPEANRVYELRVYYANDGKFDAMHARFRNHTNALFVKHGMTPIAYWVPQDEADGKHQKLIYVLAFPSRDAAKAAWAAFSADPEWQRVKSESEKDGRLVAKVESIYMDPTDYSPMK